MLARPIHLFGQKLHLAPLLDVAIHLLHIKLRFLLEHLYWRLVLIVNYSRWQRHVDGHRGKLRLILEPRGGALQVMLFSDDRLQKVVWRIQGLILFVLLQSFLKDLLDLQRAFLAVQPLVSFRPQIPDDSLHFIFFFELEFIIFYFWEVLRLDHDVAWFQVFSILGPEERLLVGL